MGVSESRAGGRLASHVLRSFLDTRCQAGLYAIRVLLVSMPAMFVHERACANIQCWPMKSEKNCSTAYTIPSSTFLCAV